jgi:PAS domain S-box-containing protein
MDNKTNSDESQLRNIVIQKRAENSLNEKEEIWKAIISAAPVGIGLVRDQVLDWANESMYQMVGYEKDFLMGKKVSILYESQEEYERVNRELTTGIKEKGFGQVETRWVRKDGTIFDCFLQGKPFTPKNIFQGYVFIAIDLTERKEAEKRIKESEGKYRTLFESSSDAIFIVSWEGKFIDMNRAMLDLFGYSREEIIGINIKEIFYDADDWLRIIEDLEGIEFIKNYELKLKRKSGKKIDCLITVTSKKAPDGKTVGYQGIIRDITEYKELQAQFLHAQKMEAIGRLAGGVAHDFNNMLTSIIGHADIILMSLDQEDDLREDVEEIKNSAERAASLTRQLLIFSRNQIAQPMVLNLNDEILNMEKMLRRILREDVELNIILEPELRSVRIDPLQIEQVIVNLVDNAKDAMPEGGKLTIETANVRLDSKYFLDHEVKKRPGNYVMLSVTDSGVGMDKDIQVKIFDPFFTTKEGGTGLGLSTVYGIIKQNSGYIWVYSEPEKGTTFKIYFPEVKKDEKLAEDKDIE